MYRQFEQYRNWKMISAEYGLQYAFHLFYPEMLGRIGRHSIRFENFVHWERSPWSRLQIQVQLNNDIPSKFFILQKGNNSARPPGLGEMEEQKQSLDHLGERFALECSSADLKSIPLENPHLVNLFREYRCVGLAADGKALYYERNDISYSAEELKSTITELISLADALEGAIPRTDGADRPAAGIVDQRKASSSGR
jgi:hypothetical protein